MKITRKEARLRGLDRYFTGKPCAQGHVEPRYVGNNQCVACKAASDSIRYGLKKRGMGALPKPVVKVARSARPDDGGYLPEFLAELAGIAGLPAALAIAQAKGGVRAHFPARADDGHWLVECVGRERADLICEHFRTTRKRAAGIYEVVPLGPHHFYARARRKAIELSESGMPREEVARQLGVHMRTVQRHRGRLRDLQKRDQGRLF